MSRRTRKRMDADERRIDHHRAPWSDDLPLREARREARREAHQSRVDGFSVVLEYVGRGGWLMSGEWEPVDPLYRVRLARRG